MNRLEKIRLGQINFTNVWPVFHYFPSARFEDWLEVVAMIPTGLNKAIADGDIDLAPISSFAYAEQSEKLVLLPHLSVSAHKHVHSILLFHKVPLEQLDGKKICLTNASATSVHLLKIILERFVGIKPFYETMAPNLSEMMIHSDAALLIGDDAIQANWENDEKYYITDLANAWNAYTGLGMTFAVWAVREEIANQYPEEMNQIYKAFQESKRKGLADLEPIIQRAQLKMGGSEEYWSNYFRTLSYDLGEEQQKGLQLYFQYAYELGLLPHPIAIRFWPTIKEN
jgi:chorismate dehydratase